MNRGSEPRYFTDLPYDVQLALSAAGLLLLFAESMFLLGASGPGLAAWMWLLVIALNLLLARGLYRGPLTARRVSQVALGAAALLAGAWVVGRSFLLISVYYPLLVLVPVAALACLIRLTVSVVRSPRGNRAFLGSRAALSVLLIAVLICSLRGSPGVLWLDTWWAAHLGLRAAVTSAVDLQELQSAAIKLLETEGQTEAESDQLRLYGDEIGSSSAVPQEIRRLNPGVLVANHRGDESDWYVYLGWGGGLLHWGAEVGRPTYHRETGWRHGRNTRKWRDGIYAVFG